MKKRTLVIFLASFILSSALVDKLFVESGTANPFDLPVETGIRVYSLSYVPYRDNQFENSSVTLIIRVILVYGQYDQSWADTVHLENICYCLDVEPLVYVFDFSVENHTSYGRDKQNFLMYMASVKLENLSEGSHTVTAYANDTLNEYAYINDLSASYSFAVDSYHQAPMTSAPVTEGEPFSTSPLPLASMVGIGAVAFGLFSYFERKGKGEKP